VLFAKCTTSLRHLTSGPIMMNTGFLALNGQIVCVVADTLGAFHLHDSFVGVH